MEKITVVIVDDHSMYRQMLKLVLSDGKSCPALGFSLDVVGACGTPEEAVELVRQKKPQLLLLDINLGGKSGIQIIPNIRKHSPGTQIIGLSMNEQLAYAKKMLQLGAKGYVTKSSSFEELVKAINDVLHGKTFLSSIVADQMLMTNLQEDPSVYSPLSSLTLRELEIIKLIKQGLTSREISEKLFIGVRTVEGYHTKILKKLHLKNKASLISFIHSTDLNFI